MRVAIFSNGNGSNFDNLISQQYKNIAIVLLVCNNTKAFVIERAKKYNIQTYIFDSKEHSRKLYETMIFEVLQQYKIDFLVLAGYMKIIGEILINIYESKIITSLMPPIFLFLWYKQILFVDVLFGDKYTKNDISIAIH
ncbi:MAG: formyltransferase family protein [Chitinophagaceae bacterium]